MRRELKWRVGFGDFADVSPTETIPAHVPGSVQLDFMREKGMPDFHFGTNYREYLWMEDKFFHYSAQVDGAPLDGRRVVFVSKGIDYRFEIRLNGKTLHAQEGMYTPVWLDITDELVPGDSANLLEVVIHPIPKLKGEDVEPGTRGEAAQAVKPAVSYGWDWHPRLVPSGIWQESWLEIRKSAAPFKAEVSYDLCGDLSAAEVALRAKGQGEVHWKMEGPDGEVVFDGCGHECRFTLENPRLWWCNGMGLPQLYTWTAACAFEGETETLSGKTGFRKVELVMNPGTWEEPAQFPKSRSHPPITLRLNGKEIFAKGTNWVLPDIFYSSIGRETYQSQLMLAKQAHFNLLRCWGGSGIFKRDFYELCDEYGLMVWQEFPLACNNYVGTSGYLAVLEREASSILDSLKGHPSIAIWCGGNELFNSWSLMTDQSLALRLLDKLCYERDRNTPFIMTSPLDGMAHGCYTFVYPQPNAREVYQAMNESRFTAYTEFGVPSMASEECLRLALPEEELFPLRETENTTAHHAFNAWGTGETWSCLSTFAQYFGPPQSLKDLIEKSQWMQSEGYKCIYEEARRQKPYCSMALNWCYNEPWPCAANNSLLCYPGVPKPAYYAVQASCRPVLPSARLFRFVYREGELFEADLWLLNDSPEGVGAGMIKAELCLGDAVYPLLDWAYADALPNQNIQGPRLRMALPRANCEEMILRLTAGELVSEYRLMYSKRVFEGQRAEKVLNL